MLESKLNNNNLQPYNDMKLGKGRETEYQVFFLTSEKRNAINKNITKLKFDSKQILQEEFKFYSTLHAKNNNEIINVGNFFEVPRPKINQMEQHSCEGLRSNVVCRKDNKRFKKL